MKRPFQILRSRYASKRALTCRRRFVPVLDELESRLTPAGPGALGPNPHVLPVMDGQPAAKVRVDATGLGGVRPSAAARLYNALDSVADTVTALVVATFSFGAGTPAAHLVAASAAASAAAGSAVLGAGGPALDHCFVQEARPFPVGGGECQPVPPNADTCVASRPR
jgi:hypothetical protein